MRWRLIGCPCALVSLTDRRSAGHGVRPWSVVRGLADTDDLERPEEVMRPDQLTNLAQPVQ